MATRRVDALAITDDVILKSNARGLAALTAKRRLPATGFKEFAKAGGLMAYGADVLSMLRRGIGSSGAPGERSLRMADYVTVRRRADGAHAAGGC